jgi:uncharacterized protein (TIGR03437 family)
MAGKGRAYWAKAAVILAAIPLLIWAYSEGPVAGVCGVPGELGTCTQANCHVGTTNDPANNGSVTVNFPNGLTYAPGAVQHLSVTIADPAPTQAAWGFQLTARTAVPGTQAGTFASSDPYTGLQCAEAGNVNNESLLLSLPGAQVCPSNMSLAYIEHNYSGYLHTMGQGSGTYQFDWTPPAANVGSITIYVAGNAGHGGEPTTIGDHVYARTYTLTPSAAGDSPAITSVVANATGLKLIGPNTYVNIVGSNLSNATDVWSSVMVNNTLPTRLDNVSVTIGGKAAYVQYVSPTQIQVLTPPDLGVGPVAVEVTNSAGTSSAMNVTSEQYAPGFFLWANNQPVATHADYSDAMKNGTYAGLTTVPARPGEYIVLWGTGFGPTTPAAPAGTLVPRTVVYYTAATPSLTLNGQPMAYYATALTPTFAGLYQVVAQVPAVPDGDWPLIATIGGVSSPGGVLLTVHH